MKKRILCTALAIALIFSLLAGFQLSLSAEKEGIFRYEIMNGGATIMEYTEQPIGTLVIPETLGGYPVKEIYHSAFQGCSSLEKVIIPDSVTTVGYKVFYNCTSLTDIEVSDNNQNFSSIDGVLFSKDKTVLLCYPCGKDTEYTIPNGVVEIAQHSFFGCKNITSITVSNTVKKIDHAFGECLGLTDLIFEGSVPRISIETLKSTPWYNNWITNQPSGLLIMAGCIVGHKGAVPSDILIPDTVVGIGDDAFKYLSSLTTVTIPNSVVSIGSFAFASCDKLTEVIIPDSVKYLGTSAFSECYGLTSAKIGNGVTDIERRAFYSCTKLTSVQIGTGVTGIGDSAFDGCVGLKSITIPDSVKTIGEYAFSNCTGLTSITVPDSVIAIGSGSFEGCTSLEYAIVGRGVTSISSVAFNGCTVLKNMVFLTKAASIIASPIPSDTVIYCYENTNVAAYFMDRKNTLKFLPDLNTASPTLSVLYVSNENIAVSWGEVSNATSYNIYLNGELYASTTEPFYSFAGLTASSKYSIDVTAVFVGVESKRCNEISVETVTYKTGDIDQNGQIGLADAMKVFMFISGKYVLNDEKLADLNANGKVEIDDAMVLFKIVAGKVTL